MLTGFRSRLSLLIVVGLMSPPALHPPTRVAHSYKLQTPLATLMVGHAFYDWVNSANGPEFLTSTAPAYPRRCTVTLDCDTKKAKTYVSIAPAKEAHDLDPRGALGYGVVAAYLIPDKNYGKYTEWRYHVPKDQDPVYIVVESAGAGKAKWTAVQVNKKESIALTAGMFLECPDAHDPDPTSVAGFGGCPMNHAAARNALQKLIEMKASDPTSARVVSAQAALKKTLTFDPYDDTAAWISCIYGCCVAEF